MQISRAQLEEMVAHAREVAPEECCGMVAVRDGVVTDVHRASNAEASPYRFVIEPREQLELMNRIDAAGAEIGAIYHSHTRSAPKPSETDMIFARGWPGVLWVIVGLAEDQPAVRTWRIDDGQISEVELEVA
jgi:proteasome lid subunit RPN8/RPN11